MKEGITGKQFVALILGVMVLNVLVWGGAIWLGATIVKWVWGG